MKNNAGFSLIEIIIVIAILSVLATVVVFDFVSFSKNSDLNNASQEFVGILKLAQNKALSSDNYDQYGVYINTGVSPNQYVLFKGSSYASKTGVVQTYSVKSTTEFYGISLGGGNEIVFDRITGATDEMGSVSIRAKTDTSKNKTIYVVSSGAVSFSAPLDSGVLDASRVKDYRHIQFTYNQSIDTTSENIVLTFDNSQTVTVPINLYLVGGQLQWQGTTSVSGANQIVEINTHMLNGPNTIFSIHRDRRYNTKILKVAISGDSSGYLAQFSADGSTANYSSAYVSNFTQE